MDSFLVITIPMALIVVGIALNSFHFVHDQAQFSLEENAADARRDALDRHELKVEAPPLLAESRLLRQPSFSVHY